MGWMRYVAVGDSFTEGIGDPRPDGRDRGWADRVAESLAGEQPGFRYANLAIRGRRLADIVAEQVPRAVDLGPDLVTLAGGVNDALRRHWDVSQMALQLESGVAPLRATGADVVIVTYGRPAGRSFLIESVRRRLAEYREATYDIAGRHQCRVVDFWEYTVFQDSRFWSGDRLHLNPVGHQRVAMAVLAVLGRPSKTPWWTPLPEVRPLPATVRAGRTVTWAGRYLAPWLGRGLTGRNSGDGVTAKRPQLLPVSS
ncbi:MAG TPA: SGNH/GDSL hydrolase family protein [Actinomycetota bacterium]|nr:SGNH/GDSL hydrolase family protein [Actinomycetota bacterium]